MTIGQTPDELTELTRNAYRDLVTFRPRSKGWRDARLAQRFSQTAWSSFPSSRLMRTAHGEVLLPLSSGQGLWMARGRGQTMNARARPLGDSFVASLDESLCRAIFELSAGLWTNPRVLSAIGRVERLPLPPRVDAALPRGLEHVAAVVRRDFKGEALPPQAWEPPRWLDTHLPLLCEQRARALHHTFEAGLRFLLLHELGHVCLGHLDLLGGVLKPGLVSMEELDLPGAHDPQSTSSLLTSGTLRRGLEVCADRFALNTAFAASSRSDADARSARLSKLLGALVVYIIFHSLRELAGVSETASTHPPLWFRCHDALASATMSWPGDEGPLNVAIRSIAESHGMLGAWLGPIAGNELATICEAVLVEARQTLRPYEPTLRQYSKRFVLRPSTVLATDELLAENFK